LLWTRIDRGGLPLGGCPVDRNIPGQHPPEQWPKRVVPRTVVRPLTGAGFLVLKSQCYVGNLP